MNWWGGRKREDEELERRSIFSLIPVIKTFSSIGSLLNYKKEARKESEEFPAEMELSCVASPRGLYVFPSTSASSGCGFCRRDRRKVAGWSRINASTEGSPEPIHTAGANKPQRRDFPTGGPAMDVSASPVSSGTTSTTVVERSLAGGGDYDFSVLEKLATVVRLSYGIGLSQRIPFAFLFLVSLTPQRLIRCCKCMDRSKKTENSLLPIEYSLFDDFSVRKEMHT